MPRPPPKEKKNSFIPKTKLQQSNLKSDGRITGWFKLAPGRPPSDPVLPITLPDSETKQQPAVAPSVKKRNDRSGGYVRWADPENQALLKIALQEDSNSADDLDPLIISRSSLYSIKKRHSEGIVISIRAISVVPLSTCAMHVSFLIRDTVLGSSSVKSDKYLKNGFHVTFVTDRRDQIPQTASSIIGSFCISIA
jgi:hypothetical protein